MEEETRPRAQFQRVAQVIRERIGHGVYPVGSRLPPIAVLATELDSSHMTIKQALATLSSEGVIASRRGVPAEVVASPSTGKPLSVAERLARVEGIIGSLEERVSAIEGHASHPSGDHAPSP
jgi:GntR family transcriptional regulator